MYVSLVKSIIFIHLLNCPDLLIHYKKKLIQGSILQQVLCTSIIH